MSVMCAPRLMQSLTPHPTPLHPGKVTWGVCVCVYARGGGGVVQRPTCSGRLVLFFVCFLSMRVGGGRSGRREQGGEPCPSPPEMTMMMRMRMMIMMAVIMMMGVSGCRCVSSGLAVPPLPPSAVQFFFWALHDLYLDFHQEGGKSKCGWGGVGGGWTKDIGSNLQRLLLVMLFCYFFLFFPFFFLFVFMLRSSLFTPSSPPAHLLTPPSISVCCSALLPSSPQSPFSTLIIFYDVILISLTFIPFVLSSDGLNWHRFLYAAPPHAPSSST